MLLRIGTLDADVLGHAGHIGVAIRQKNLDATLAAVY